MVPLSLLLIFMLLFATFNSVRQAVPVFTGIRDSGMTTVVIGGLVTSTLLTLLWLPLLYLLFEGRPGELGAEDTVAPASP